MKVLFAVAAAAIALLTTAPLAFALELQTSHPSADAADQAPDADVVRKNLTEPRPAIPGMTTLGTTKLGNTTIHFGASRSSGAVGGNDWFLDSPAARTVPSQRE